MKREFLIIIILISSLSGWAQKERKFIRSGNSIYQKALADTSKVDTIAYSNAEVEYRKALEKKPNDFKSQYNIGNALFKQEKMEEAFTQYEQALQNTTDTEKKANLFFNQGNSLIARDKIDESIEAYKNALRSNPNDIEAKYNLRYAQKLKQKQEEQQQQQQQQDQNKDQQDQNKDQQNKDQQNQDQNQDQQDQNKDQQQDQNNQQQNQDQQKQNQDQQQDQQKQDQQQQQQPQNKISRQNAEQMLKALQNDEKGVQEKVKKAQAAKAKKRKTEKDW